MSRIRTSIAALAIAGVSATAVVPATADAASAKSSVKKAFNSAFDAAKAGNYTKFCKAFTKASLKEFGGLQRCADGVGKAAGNFIKQAGALSIKSVSAKGSKGSVKWSAGKTYTTTLKKESGKWKLVKVLG